MKSTVSNVSLDFLEAKDWLKFTELEVFLIGFDGFGRIWGLQGVPVLVFRKLSGGIEGSRGPLFRCLGRARGFKEVVLRGPGGPCFVV